MKKTKLVTALWRCSGHPFYGHEEIARLQRYLHSLTQSICKTEVDIVCYANSTAINILKNEIRKLGIKNIELKHKELIDIGFSKRMIEVKESNGDKFNFYHEVDWAKIDLLEYELDDAYEYIYWIDSGLSHRGLWHVSNNTNRELITGMSGNPHDYEFTGIFCEELFPKINEFVGDKLLDIGNKQLWHPTYSFCPALEISNDEYMQNFISQTTGGIIGGHISKLPDFIERFKVVAGKMLDKNQIANHEALMSVIRQQNLKDYKCFHFGTWYHRDMPLCMHTVTYEDVKDQVSFSDFFENLLIGNEDLYKPNNTAPFYAEYDKDET